MCRIPVGSLVQNTREAIPPGEDSETQMLLLGAAGKGAHLDPLSDLLLDDVPAPRDQAAHHDARLLPHPPVIVRRGRRKSLLPHGNRSCNVPVGPRLVLEEGIQLGKGLELCRGVTLHQLLEGEHCTQGGDILSSVRCRKSSQTPSRASSLVWCKLSLGRL